MILGNFDFQNARSSKNETLMLPRKLKTQDKGNETPKALNKCCPSLSSQQGQEQSSINFAKIGSEKVKLSSVTISLQCPQKD